LIIVRYLFFLKLKVQLILILCSDRLRHLSLFTSASAGHLFYTLRFFFLIHLPPPLAAYSIFVLLQLPQLLLLLVKEVELVVLLVHPDWHEALVKVSRKLIVLLHNPYLIEQKILT